MHHNKISSRSTSRRQQQLAALGHLAVLAFTLICLPCCQHGVEGATEYNRYLAHIFHKYGNGGTMSFEVSPTIKRLKSLKNVVKINSHKFVKKPKRKKLLKNVLCFILPLCLMYHNNNRKKN